MFIITNKGLYFAGKIKDLPTCLKLLGKKQTTLKNLINKNLQ
jgi:hypothetical protein